MRKLSFRVCFLLTAFVLAGCAFDQIESGITALKGQKIQTAFDYLGYPDNEQEIAGSKVYTWGNAFASNTLTPVTNYSSGNIYGLGGGATSYSGATTSYIPQTNIYSCEIKLITNQNGIITNGQYKGDLDGCFDYGNALDKAANDLGPVLDAGD